MQLVRTTEQPDLRMQIFRMRHLTQTMKLKYVIYGSTTTVIANLIFLANKPTPDLIIHQLE